MENKNGLASGFYLILALTSGLEPPIMSWYSHIHENSVCIHEKKKIFMNAHKCVHNIGS